MAKGGFRKGAGRKKGVANLLTQQLRELIRAKPLIRFLQDLAEGKIEEASISHRIDAATSLLKKVLPDYRLTDLEDELSELISRIHEERHANQKEATRWMDFLDSETRKKIYHALDKSMKERSGDVQT